MNVENIKAVRDLIASLPPERLDMRSVARFITGDKYARVSQLKRNCGTAGCIAGWAQTLMSKDERETLSTDEWFDITDERFSELCLPNNYAEPGYYTQADAIATLDHLIETGEVKWPSKSGAA